eukprot:TRINITY_DN12084_c0_g1_i4.p2 TRINITY_DN12084_c0_g1~~TRINITY_DN12084_c0_g1_i4.p2  ORF type:complete len:160 (-),score=40.11 TRINITY_DN12084_c0_g1_i4:352-831(-)
MCIRDRYQRRVRGPEQQSWMRPAKSDYTRSDTGELRKGYLSSCVLAHLKKGPCEVQDAPSHVPSYIVDPSAPIGDRNKPAHPLLRFPTGYSVADVREVAYDHSTFVAKFEKTYILDGVPVKTLAWADMRTLQGEAYCVIEEERIEETDYRMLNGVSFEE